MFWSAFGVVAAGWVAGCNRSSSSSGAADAGAEGGITACPPAPLEDEYYGRPCGAPDLACPYASPLAFSARFSTTCGNAQCTGYCRDGTFKTECNAVLCCAGTPGQVTWCGGDVVAGAACNRPDNSECVLPDQSATCACDKPGPLWRCLPIDGGVSYCDCDAGGCYGPGP